MPPPAQAKAKPATEVPAHDGELTTAHDGSVDPSAARNGKIDVSAAHNGSVDPSAAHNGAVDLSAAQNGSVDPSAAQNGKVDVSATHDGEAPHVSFDPVADRAKSQPPGRIPSLIARRVEAATAAALSGPNRRLMQVQMPAWRVICDLYFRLELTGWERLPDEPSLLIGNHSGGSLTMDAWTFVVEWWRRFGDERILHGTAHDVLMAVPGLGDYFRQVGVIPASRKGVSAALASGCDVIIWPGGEVDSMRSWRRRDEAVLAGHKGFVRQAMRSGVPIVPVASVGAHDTAFVLSDGRWLANGIDRFTGLKKKLRGTSLPIVLGFPFGLTIETIPTHIPLPAKIRTELLEPIYVDHDPERLNDRAYVNSVYTQVESAIQEAMDRLAKRRRLPIFG